MCGFTITNKRIEDVRYVDEFTCLRGPDETTVTEIAGLTVVHHLLWLTGKRTPQPFVHDDMICVFNGEIYNYKDFGDYDTDGECLIPLFREHGSGFTQLLDGEYAIALIDLKTLQAHFYRDIFGTKPIFYANDGENFAVSSYASSLQRLGFQEWSIPDRTPNDFDLFQYKDTYDDWIEAFEQAVQKRVGEKPMFIGLSSGYDSGAIDCALKRLGATYTAISIGTEYLEGRQSERFPLPPDPKTIDISYIDQEYNYPLSLDIASYGQTLLATIARDKGLKICLSGHGADEIMWGYDPEYFATHNQKLIRTFYDYEQEWYLGTQERISGAHGIESRYPFLDKKVVQEYLSLTPDLKNRYYKAPIHAYLSRHDYPFEAGIKRGFGMGIKGRHVVKKAPEDNPDFRLYEKISKSV